MKKLMWALPLMVNFTSVIAYNQDDVDAFKAQLAARGDDRDAVIEVNGGDFREYTFEDQLRNVIFKGADFEDANFKRILKKVIIEDSNLERTILRGLKTGAIRRSKMSGTFIKPEGELQGMPFKNVTFEQSRIQVNFEGVDFIGETTFDECEVEGDTSFVGAQVGVPVNYGKIKPAVFKGEWGGDVIIDTLIEVERGQKILDAAEAEVLQQALAGAFTDEEDALKAKAMEEGYGETHEVSAYVDAALRPYMLWVEGKPFPYTKPLTRKAFSEQVAERAAAIAAASLGSAPEPVDLKLDDHTLWPTLEKAAAAGWQRLPSGSDGGGEVEVFVTDPWDDGVVRDVGVPSEGDGNESSSEPGVPENWEDLLGEDERGGDSEENTEETDDLGGDRDGDDEDL